jgi:alpha-tubulin suppressor-like RCC1 family protein
MAFTLSGISGITGLNLTTTHPVPPEFYLWSWGFQNFGQLGLGDTASRSSPNQVGALTNWSSTAGQYLYNLALKTDGTMWTWGYNDSGHLGLGNTTRYSSPKQIGALTTWAKISARFGGGVAIKTDGTLWTWGGNGQGSLGLGDTTNRSSPVQVGTRTAWANVFVANNTFAIG